MDIRARKKVQRRRDLVANAIALFRERGFEAVKVRDVTDRCLVSEATFFNYFGSRHGLLSEWVHERVGEVLDERLLPERPLRAGLRAAARDLARWREEEGALARLALEHCRARPDPAAPGQRSDWRWRARVAEAQRAGELRRDLPAAELCDLLQAALVAACAASVHTPGDVPAERLQRAVDLVADGARRRHERVRAGAVRPAPHP